MRLMQLNSYFVPLAGAAIGAACAATLAALGPDAYSAFSTVRVERPADSQSAGSDQLEQSIASALAAADAARLQTSIELVAAEQEHTTVRLGYHASNASRALVAAEELSVALVEGVGSDQAQIVEAPRLPDAPAARSYSGAAVAGGAVGIAAGFLWLTTRARRRRSAARD
jgi:hypothetical protein